MGCTCVGGELVAVDCPQHGDASSVFMKQAGRSALDVQVGGGHYKDMKIQPVEFITANNIGFLEGCVIKRICRWRSKDGVQDLEKIKHEVDLLIELERKSKAGAAMPGRV